MPYTTLISPDELLPYLKDPQWVVVDCRFDLFDPAKGEQDYLKAHIPRAVYAHLERDLSAVPTGTNGRHPLPTIEDLISTFSKWGIGETVQVVAYDDRGGSFAARLWWCLRYMGHKSVAVLNGGFPSWERAGFPTTSGVENRPPRSFKSLIQVDMLVHLDQIHSMIGSPDVLLLDARAPERYRGEEEPIDPIAGHIPGALNRFWQLNLDKDDRFLPPTILHKEFERILKPGGRLLITLDMGENQTNNRQYLRLIDFCSLKLIGNPNYKIPISIEDKNLRHPGHAYETIGLVWQHK